MGNYKTSELKLFRELWHTLKPGDLLLSDRGFCTYVNLWHLYHNSVDFVVRARENLRKNFAVKTNLEKNDRIVKWFKSKIRPDWIDQETWAKIPDTLLLREITYYVGTPGFRTEKIVVVSSLFSKQLFPTEAFAELYYSRWRGELFLRNIKTTMGMDILRCKTPEMIEKEVLMFIIAYNLIRVIIFQAGTTYDAPIDRISFKGAVNTMNRFLPCFQR